MADVRNGYGFAGVKTHEPIDPFFARRGVPSDASAEYLAEVESWDVDGHSHSFATVAELKAAPWNDVIIRHQGYLTVKEYERIRNSDKLPDSWCGGTSAHKVTAQAYENNYRGRLTSTDDTFQSPMYILYVWDAPITEYVGDFVDNAIPTLEALGSPEDVRIVFFFDN